MLDTKLVFEVVRNAFQGVPNRQRSSESDYTDISNVSSFHVISTYRRRLSKLTITIGEWYPSFGTKPVVVGIGNEISHVEVQGPFLHFLIAM